MEFNLSTATDQNHDGILDAWKDVHFGGNQLVPGDDSDHDGLTNEEEYARGTYPGWKDTDFDTIDDGIDLDPLIPFGVVEQIWIEDSLPADAVAMAPDPAKPWITPWLWRSCFPRPVSGAAYHLSPGRNTDVPPESQHGVEFPTQARVFNPDDKLVFYICRPSGPLGTAASDFHIEYDYTVNGGPKQTLRIDENISPFDSMHPEKFVHPGIWRRYAYSLVPQPTLPLLISAIRFTSSNGSLLWDRIGKEVVPIPKPRLSPGGGRFPNPVLVTLSSANSGFRIYYTTNNSDPTRSSPSTANGGSIQILESKRLIARAGLVGDTVPLSDPTVADFLIDDSDSDGDGFSDGYERDHGLSLGSNDWKETPTSILRDYDLDGIPNVQDPRPFDSSVSQISISISFICFFRFSFSE